MKLILVPAEADAAMAHHARKQFTERYMGSVNINWHRIVDDANAARPPVDWDALAAELTIKVSKHESPYLVVALTAALKELLS